MMSVLPRRRFTALPGLGLTLGVSLLWVSLIVLLPLVALAVRTIVGWHDFIDAAFTPRALASYRVTFGAAALAAAIDCVIGLQLAWVLTRYDFPGRQLLGALVDLPFALPTAVAGIALTAIYADSGLLGAPLARIGLPVAYQPGGIVVALVFIGLPFIVRTVEPVLREASRDLEEAALTLGASRFAIFRRVILPTIAPALATGFALAFARGAGEYGSVIFIAGNMPFKTEIAPLMIVTQLEQYDYAGATGIACVMLLVSFLVLFLINWLQRVEQRRTGQ